MGRDGIPLWDDGTKIASMPRRGRAKSKDSARESTMRATSAMKSSCEMYASDKKLRHTRPSLTLTMRLFVDEHKIAELRCEAWAGCTTVPTLPDEIRINHVDGYERREREWFKLERRCRLVATSTGDAAQLKRYVENLVNRRKAAIVDKDKLIAPVAMDSGCCLLFAGPPVQSSFELRLEMPGGWRTLSLRCNVKTSDLTVRLQGGYCRGELRGLDPTAVALVKTAGAQDLAATLSQQKKFAVAEEGARLTPNGKELDVWLDRSLIQESDDQTAADFYNKLQRTKENEGQTRIYHLRRFNNWVKAELIARALPSPHAAVVDLACGKGGDLGKFAKSKVAKYVGVDIAKQSLDDLAERLQGMQNFADVTLVALSLGSVSLFESSLPTWSRGEWTDVKFEATTFDAASMQFALHYMFETRDRANTFFSDVSKLLRVGGAFVATTIDAVALARLVLERGVPCVRDGRKFWRVDIDDEPVENVKGFGTLERESWRVLTVLVEDDTRRRILEGGDAWGLRYWFQLNDGDKAMAVDSPEWLVPLPLLASVASDHNLRLEIADNFSTVLNLKMQDADFAKSIRHMRVPDIHGSLSPAEWDVACLYVALVFRKRASDAQIAAAFPVVMRAYGAQVWGTFSNDQQLALVHACAEGRPWQPNPS